MSWNPAVPINYQRTPCNHQPIRFFDNVSAKYYPIDDLMLLVGHIYTKGNNAIRAGAEYIPDKFRGSATVASLFVDGAYGWNKSSSIMGGRKIYFGNRDKSLKRLHREDDPSAAAYNAFLEDIHERSAASDDIARATIEAKFKSGKARCI